MKIKEIFNLKNVSNFIEGYAKYFYDKLVGLPQHTKEQILWRLSICADDCLVKGECKECGCDPKKKVFNTESCNNGERFPDLMNEEEWLKYKEENNIYD